MGVDYIANRGVGFKVNRKELEEDDFCFEEYLDETLEGSGYKYFSVGSGAYTGKQNDLYVVLSDFLPLESLKERLDELKNYLLSIGIIDEDAEYDLVGGVCVC
ncbi:hypothetical protein CMU26_01125 [Elizabethkingia anophelis]|nr:hypothetical protein [Elizabethkingia anophelis]